MSGRKLLDPNTYMKGSFMVCTLHQKSLGDQINNKEMSGACGMHRGGKRLIQVLAREPGGKNTFERPRRRWKND